MTTLKNLLHTEYIAIDKNGVLKDAINCMHKNRQGVVVVVSNNIPFGIITERDILNIIHNNTDSATPISNILTPKALITINQKRSIEYALHVLIDNNIRRLIVVDNNGQFQGVVTQDILVKNLERNAFTTDILISNFIPHKKDLISLLENDTITNAFLTMTNNNVGSIIVLNTNGDAIGIVTEKDAIYVANNSISTNLPISSIMSSPIISIKDNQPVKDVIDMMAFHKINRIIIVDDITNKPISIVSMREIAENLKGNYGKLLEYKLKSIKNTLNYIGEYVFEICEDNNEQIIQWTNSKATDKFGNYFDKNIYDLIEASQWDDIHKKLVINGECQQAKVNIKNMYFELNCSYYFSNHKETLLLILRDVTHFENAIKDEINKNIALSDELIILKSVINQQSNIIFISDGTNISLVNQAFFNFFDIANMTEFESKFSNIANTFIAHQNFFTMKSSDKNWIDEITNLYERDKVVSIIDHRTFEPKVFGIQFSKLASDETNFIITFTDITEEKLESQKYYFNATHDALTKIYNKSFLLDSLNISLEKTKRYGSVFSLVFLNIDNLKDVNNKHGFLHGDMVVVEISKAIDQHIRSCDIFARFCGEDFALILPETNIQKAQLLAENLRKMIENLIFKEVEKQTVSFGITQLTEIDSE
ncbi:MAG: diguanylate cyclase, partial [Arcobacter sp.]|nr:diguanylate cyclase [Arcobacter sp.]